MANITASTPQLKAVKNFFDAYLTLNIRDVASQVSNNFTFQTFPKIPELPDEEKEKCFERYGSILSSFTKLEFIVHEVTEAPGKVIIHFTALCSTPEDNTLEYDSLCIFTLAEEDGELKITHLKDFSNPENRGRLHDWGAKVLAKGVPAV